MSKVKTLILRTPGTNCDVETSYAFELAGSETELVHINRLLAKPSLLSEFQIMAFPGGFGYGDDLGAGRVLANEVRLKLGEKISRFHESGGLIIGICNGFQALVKTGILPGPIKDGQKITLTDNNSGRFECRWTYLSVNPFSTCVFTQGLDRLYLPVAHGEGKLLGSPEVINKLNSAVYYTDKDGKRNAPYPANPAGTLMDIAGIADESGRIFALMPHPERFVRGSQHPRWTGEGLKKEGDGLKIFTNAVKWAREV
ncbi:phosphoribosylformylglycinamidine synthase [Dehalococcoides mccartyi]|jgi:phosphoribosylformylglycinamidine synthase|uniref:Phosphoribosylformylglycinamidine synthase subunit PurQ n=2 Tax=Dehalococcoides mccartyi TaxID=61435 RepID=A0A328ELC9_9CHLR|nr:MULTISPECIES: phosphoribosylformylglycinamidine synthase subunit PurQ [Dehalococcoides]AGG06022.1 phosphoribosylformylglycinamidine synthase 1 [Dehalococcoides mccartyi DCMB5]AQX74203.1 phosphoribosylformylglycinamidine synthase [Dehalococcoides mccartyi]AQY72779.1 phosphoribosylformylglycinamidine synthase [Dehalococcoides mccartyi]KSV16658.1 phosphoribosylformylglycinamidine synthase [Dehalococcoides mccartyi]PKH46835.1 phosphoribosylformylglycinamidine synthase [Dehalococcoides mccartyi]